MSVLVRASSVAGVFVGGGFGKLVDGASKCWNEIDGIDDVGSLKVGFTFSYRGVEFQSV